VGIAEWVSVLRSILAIVLFAGEGSNNDISNNAKKYKIEANVIIKNILVTTVR